MELMFSNDNENNNTNAIITNESQQHHQQLIHENQSIKELLTRYELKIRHLEAIKDRATVVLRQCVCEANNGGPRDQLGELIDTYVAAAAADDDEWPQLVTTSDETAADVVDVKLVSIDDQIVVADGNGDSGCNSGHRQHIQSPANVSKRRRKCKVLNNSQTEEDGKSWSCEWLGCHYRCDSKHKLSAHHRFHHNNNNNNKKTTSGSKASDESTVAAVVADNRKRRSSKRVWDCMRYRCNWPGCERAFPTNNKLSTHLRVHTGERPYVCQWPDCHKSFHIKGSLKLHTNLHLNLKSFHCHYDDCDDSFTRVEQLDKHVYEVHTGIMPYLCQWPGCGYQTCYRQRLHLHKRKHTGEKPYRCEWDGCESSFTEAHHLKAHERKHTGERPYGCEWPGCERRYKNRQAMRFHMERVHNKLESLIQEDIDD